jgi:hypothetical protein
MEKIYIPERRKCYLCSAKALHSKDPNWEPYHMVGFRDKPQRWVFCNDCMEKWFRWSDDNLEGKCPRRKVFKVGTGKCPMPANMKRRDQWQRDLALLPRIT